MRLVTGDECGLLKETVPELCRPKLQQQDEYSNKPLSSTQDGVRRVDPNELQKRARGVIDLCFLHASNDTSFAALRANGSVQLWESSRDDSKQAFGTYACTGVVPNVFENTSTSNDDSDESTQDANSSSPQQQQGRPIALDSLLDKKRLCAADSLGNISILSTDNAATPSVVTTYSPFAKQAQQTLSYTKGSYQNTSICTTMAVDNRNERVAVGGRERETVLLDVHSGETVWKAKNLPPDPQTLLQHPVWSTALLFLDSSCSAGNHIMATGTAFKQVRLYDVRTNSTTRRPISYTPEGVLSHRVTALCQVDSNQLVVGDAAGFLYSLDIRTLGKKRKGDMNLARFVGPVGSIRQVVKHPTLPVIATVGLDRMLRTFDITKRKQLDCIYMKQRLNCALFCNDDAWTGDASNDTSNIVGADEDEGGWNAEDDVHDYVDSSEEENDGSDESASESEQDDSADDDSDSSSEDESESESEEESSPRHVSKKRRV